MQFFIDNKENYYSDLCNNTENKKIALLCITMVLLSDLSITIKNDIIILNFILIES